MARVVFLGTPEYGVPVLEALAAEHQVVAVVTQPDRAAGRGRRLVPPPVKVAAGALGIEVLQPRGMRRENETVVRLRDLGADVFVLAAFGQILRRHVLEIPPHGVLGVHASLLPRWRGAAPVAAAILAGDQETGVTLMRTDEGMDTGDIIAQRALPIAPDDTTGTLTDRLAHLGAGLVIDTLSAWIAGEISPRPQDEALATFAPQLEKGQGRIDWAQPAETIARQVRAYNPWPVAHTTWQGRLLRILAAKPIAGPEDAPDPGAAPGTVVEMPGGVAVVCGRGLLALWEVQAEGKRAMDAGAFARGQRGLVGSVLGGAA
jgi:methionyl-tRNA formyltransferase